MVVCVYTGWVWKSSLITRLNESTAGADALVGAPKLYNMNLHSESTCSYSIYIGAKSEKCLTMIIAKKDTKSSKS